MGYAVSKHTKSHATNFDDIRTTCTDDTENYRARKNTNSDLQVKPELLLQQIENAKSWPESFESVWGSELQDSVHELFSLATKEMTELSKARRFSQAEEIAKSIIELSRTWGEKMLNSLMLKSYIREVIPTEVNGTKYSIVAGEYFKTEPFYDKDKRLVKLFYFHVKEDLSKCRVFSYYLECSNIIQPFYVLGLIVSGTHVQVEVFDRSCPSYWVVRAVVLDDIKTRMNVSNLVRSNNSQQSEVNKSPAK